jgi:hypothetical protein
VFHEPKWTESWFPDAFAGTMGQLLIALETGKEPAISGEDNLKTMALVEGAYLSAAQFRSVALYDIEGKLNPAQQGESAGSFTPRALRVIKLARDEARRMSHNFLGTEHLLLGLIKLGQGVAVNVLDKLGLNLEAVRAEVIKQVPTGVSKPTFENTPYTPRVKKVLSLAEKQAKHLHHTYIGTESLLLGLLEEGDGVAAKVLRAFKVDIEECRCEILRELAPNSNNNNRTKPK